MANIIFYFSGTGNSLTVARDMADKLGNTKIVSVAKAIKESPIDLLYERIGFVFPVYFTSVPPIIKRFIAKLNLDKSQYIFGVITCGAAYGTAFIQLSQYIAERGGALNAGFPVYMPGNNINLYNAWPTVIQRILLNREKKTAKKISKIVRAKSSVRIPKGSIFVKLSKVSIETMEDYGKMSLDYHVTEKCIGCGTCEKICPVSNIRMENKKPRWGDACERCVACIQWCPTKAIEYAHKTAKRKQYRHPEVKISDLLS
ncbi:EFR1 family ferrodoxin [Clostridium sp. WILCCON 0269]|uniref:Ferredoxin n=1 Tax=Candidatus Clostridium eludens TaxID=3381663 RepID=A0ABW8SRG6_9CLOT